MARWYVGGGMRRTRLCCGRATLPQCYKHASPLLHAGVQLAWRAQRARKSVATVGLDDSTWLGWSPSPATDDPPDVAQRRVDDDPQLWTAVDYTPGGDRPAHFCARGGPRYLAGQVGTSRSRSSPVRLRNSAVPLTGCDVTGCRRTRQSPSRPAALSVNTLPRRM